MKVVIHPSQLKGNVRAPSSKSSMQRALAAALLVKGKTIIHHPGHSNDDKAVIGILKALGAEIEAAKDTLVIHSEGFPFTTHHSPLTIHCGESGLGIRMMTPVLALSNNEITITGEGSLLDRPMDFFDEIFPKLKVKIKSNNGKLPLVIKGPLQPANIGINGSLSSQFLTGLLMAYAAADAKKVSIKVNNLNSKPYIDLTLEVMKQFGLKRPFNKNYEEFFFDESTHDSRLTTHDYSVEGDWSGGAFLLVAGAIAGPITVRGLDLTSAQPDKAIVDVLMSANAGIAIEAKGIKIHPAEMNAFDFDATDCPDLFPPLAVLAAFCHGETKIKGISRLIHKESNRALALQEELGKMGSDILLQDDVMIIRGGKRVEGAIVHSHHDHRIAMACAIAGLKAGGDIIIEEAGVVRKSYPDFYNDLKMLGASVSLPNQHFNL